MSRGELWKFHNQSMVFEMYYNQSGGRALRSPIFTSDLFCTSVRCSAPLTGILGVTVYIEAAAQQSHLQTDLMIILGVL